MNVRSGLGNKRIKLDVESRAAVPGMLVAFIFICIFIFIYIAPAPGLAPGLALGIGLFSLLRHRIGIGFSMRGAIRCGTTG